MTKLHIIEHFNTYAAAVRFINTEGSVRITKQAISKWGGNSPPLWASLKEVA